MNASDAYWPDLIDGAGGGTWNPSALIEIGGAFGIKVTAPSNLEGDVSIGDNLGSQLIIYADTFVNRDIAFVAGKTATFNGFAVFNDPSTFNDTLTLAANKNFVAAAGTGVIDFFGEVTISQAIGFQVGGGVPASFGGTVDAISIDIGSGDIILDSSSLTCAVPASFSDATNFTAGVTFTSAGSVALAGPVALTGILTPSGTGRVAFRRYNLPDLNATVGINEGTLFIVPALGAGRTYTLSTTGAVTGDVIVFSAYTNTTVNVGGVAGWNLNNTGTAGENPAVAFYYDGAAWQTLWHSRI